jgi:hypothetical protein
MVGFLACHLAGSPMGSARGGVTNCATKMFFAGPSIHAGAPRATLHGVVFDIFGRERELRRFGY